MMDDDDILTPGQAETFGRMILLAARLARLDKADELALLAAIARGDRAAAERIRHQGFLRSMARELEAMLDAGGPPTYS